MLTWHPRGWYNGSTHVHLNYGGNMRNTPENLLMTANAQGMQIVSALIANKDNRILDWQYFGREVATPSVRSRRRDRWWCSEKRIGRHFGATLFTSVCATT